MIRSLGVQVGGQVKEQVLGEMDSIDVIMQWSVSHPFNQYTLGSEGLLSCDGMTAV